MAFVVLFFGGLIYTFIFHADKSNSPTMIRGVGLVMLAGALKVVALVLVERGFPELQGPPVDYTLGALAGVGMLMFMSGAGSGS